jgi:uncharacterized protein YuzE
MAQCVKVWFDREADFLEVTFADGMGYMRETDHDSVMERVDTDGNVIGFSILNISHLSQDHPLVAQLSSVA